MAKWEERWPAFEAIMKERLRDGHDAYGEVSFERRPSILAGEIQQELLDVVGWAFILWCRMRDLEVAIITRGNNPPESPKQLELPLEPRS